MSWVDCIRKVPLFAGVSDSALADLAGQFVEDKIPKGAYVFLQGDPPDWFYLLAAGEIRIVSHSQSGKDLILEIVPPGEAFGAVAVLNKFAYPASAQAVLPSTIIKLPGKSLFAFIEKHPEVAMNAVTFTGERLRKAHRMMKEIAVERVERRMAYALLTLMDRTGEPAPKGMRLDLTITRQDLASMVGTTVETAIRIMSRFTKQRIITTDKSHVTILNRAALERIASEE
ncbi:MAG: Crp/Fnr family transcriptional regulator [Nitrospirae bacterium]|nr:Crp/Fnr family transcriptional regulator [Nitrospirota bacterium]